MKAIVLIGVMGLIALGIFVVLAFKQCQETGKLAQDPNRVLGEKEREIADAQGFAREVFNQQTVKENPTGPYPVPSWVDGLQNAIENCARAIKNLPTSLGLRRHPPRLAPPGIYFTLTYLSVRNPVGITGVERGTRVVCV